MDGYELENTVEELIAEFCQEAFMAARDSKEANTAAANFSLEYCITRARFRKDGTDQQTTLIATTWRQT